MSFTAGERVGAYEILALLGTGGMGEVYRARDTRLDRTVALKFLSRPDLDFRDSLERFRREARALSRVNHPHICALHDICDEDGVAFLVMEFVQGETLADRLKLGPLRPEETLRYGAQIANALDTAHREGVVHRDLKPGNIMLTPDGVKLLDFGLAKLRRTEPDKGGTEPTGSLLLTEEGLILGTLPYMAPEQLEGKQVDARADIFALGAVLYEMTTGLRPFEGTSKAGLIAAILSTDPPPMSARQPMTPPLFERAVRRCLAKSPYERWQTARDLSAELKWILESALHESPGTPVAARPRRAALLRVAPIAAGVLVSVALGALWWMWYREQPFELRNVRLISTFPGTHREASFSPDGSMIAFISDTEGVPQVWVKNLEQGEPIPVTSGGAPASRPRWSPRNDQIVFARRGQGIWAVPPLGGPARQIVQQGRNPDLSADGARLVFEHAREIWIANSDGSDGRRVEGVARGSAIVTDLTPAFSPDGRRIAYFLAERGPFGDLWVIPAQGGEARRLTQDVRQGGKPAWTLDGRHIIFSSDRAGSRTLWRISSEGGEPQPVTTGTGEDSDVALSPDGRTLSYTNVRNSWSIRRFDPATGEERVLLEKRLIVVWPVASPDGKRLAFFGGDAVGGLHVFLMDINGNDILQLTHGRNGENIMPRWSPDGTFIYYYQERPSPSLRRMPAGGGPSVEIVPWSWEVKLNAAFHPREPLIAYVFHKPDGTEEGRIWNQQTNHETVLPEPLHALGWSRDGRSLLGDWAGVVYRCDPTEENRCEILTKGTKPAFSRDESRIFFLRGRSGRVAELWTMDFRSHKERLLRQLGPFPPGAEMIDVVDGDRIVWPSYHEGRQELWLAELK